MGRKRHHDEGNSMENDAKRRKFQRQIYQLRLDGFSKSSAELKIIAWLEELKILHVGARKRRNHCFLHFENEQMQKDAAEVLRNKEFNGSIITVDLITDDPSKPVLKVIPKPDAETLMSKVTPLWKMPYPEQLQLKQKKAEKILDDFCKQLSLETKPGLEQILPSPEVHHYRTKCEFTIGKDFEGKKQVGFLLGGFRDFGRMIVADPSDCVHISKHALEIARIFQEYIQNHPWDVLDNKNGIWRLLVVKTFSTGECMLVVQIHPQHLSQREKDEEKENLNKLLKSKVTTLLWQESDALFNGFDEKKPLETLSGSGFVHEELLGIRFRISPLAFFQVNTPATEKLYSLVKEWSLQDKRGALLDLCCGTGTIGLTMAKDAEKVVGVELSPSAIEDAKFNAEANNVKNVEYLCSRVEKAMDQVIGQLSPDSQVTAILDPPREGVHPSVVGALRKCTALKHVVFVACNPNASMRNFVDMCKEPDSKFPGKPFVMTRAQPVDLFPQTEHLELVVDFKRE
jgi:tRNA (uracil-5-)-methyltransferase